MNIFQELRQRKVYKYTGMYFGFGLGVMAVLDYLRKEAVVTPYLANTILMALVLLLPSVITLTWVHGKPSKDTWGRIPRLVIGANVLAIALLLILNPAARNIEPTVETVAVEDETGAVVERVVPKASAMRRVYLFYPENRGSAEDDWVREVVGFLHFFDLCQDAFIGTWLPLASSTALIEADRPDGHGLSRSLQRKLVRDVHVPYFVTGAIAREADGWTLETELHESESGRIVATRTFRSPNLFSLVDLSSRQLREDLGIPQEHLDENPDLPVVEISSPDLEAVNEYVLGQLAAGHRNDFESCRDHLEAAVEKDPGFAWAQLQLASTRLNIGPQDRAPEAVSAAIENLYRMPERIGFAAKALYYQVVELDAEKQMAVVTMWSRVYPQDVDAFHNLAQLRFMRGDLPGCIAAYETIRELDPTRTSVLPVLAQRYAFSGDLESAERCYRDYIAAHPTGTEGHQELANMLTMAGRLDEAREHLETIGLLVPDDLEATLGIIKLDVREGEYEASRHALEALAEKVDTAPGRYRVLESRIELAYLTGRTEVLARVLDAFRSAAAEYQNPLNVVVNYSSRLGYLAALGRPDDALRRLDELGTGYIPTVTTYLEFIRASLLVEKGRLDEAETILEDVRADAARSGMEILTSALPIVEGAIAERRGEWVRAEAGHREALKRTIQYETVLDIALARALHAQGEDEEALEHLANALKHHPAHPEAHLEAARIELRRENVERAREHLGFARRAWDGAHPDYPKLAELEELELQIR